MRARTRDQIARLALVQIQRGGGKRRPWRPELLGKVAANALQAMARLEGEEGTPAKVGELMAAMVAEHDVQRAQLGELIAAAVAEVEAVEKGDGGAWYTWPADAPARRVAEALQAIEPGSVKGAPSTITISKEAAAEMVAASNAAKASRASEV